MTMTFETTTTPALVLSGGGARGAYQVGVIKALSEAIPGSSPFPVITGVSVGAINAAVLAEGADDFRAAASKLEALWRSLTSASVFRTEPVPLFGRFLRWGTSLGLSFTGIKPPRSLLDAAPLEALLRREVDFSRIATMIDQGALRALAVTASSYTTGDSKTFFQGASPVDDWARSRRAGESTQIDAAHIMASAALPGVFEARRIGQEWFGDGALRQTAPLSPAIHLGCDRLLLIAVRDGHPDDEPLVSEDEPYPSIGVLGGQLLDIIFNDNLDADQERLERINTTLATMTDERRRQVTLRRIDTMMVRPSFDVRDVAGAHADEIPMSVKFILGSIGAMRAPWVLPSYLTFEPGYINGLIDRGYKDAQADLPNLLSFLFGNTTKRQADAASATGMTE